MSCKRQFALALLASLLLTGAACKKKASAAKPKLPGPAQAPTLTQTLPAGIEPQEVPPPPAQTARKQEPPQKPPSKKKQRASKKAASSSTQNGNSSQSANGSSAETATTAELHPPRPPIEPAATVAIGADVSSYEASRDRQSTIQLLENMETEVKKLEGQSLSSEQKSVLTQIKAYITQSRKAITDGDYERASNLAKKAQLLTQELSKH